MGLFDKETDAEKAKRYMRESDARLKAKAEAEKNPPKPQKVIEPDPTKAADTLIMTPDSIAGRIRARRDIALDADTQTEGKKKGGLVKSKKARGVGCAQRGHGKGRVC